VLFIFVAAAALSRFFVCAHILVAGGASALVLDLVLAAGVVDFGAVYAAATLCCLCFFRLMLVLVLCVGGALVGFSVGPKNARPISCLASSGDCAIDRVSRWAVSVLCTLGTEWVIVGNIVCTLGTDGMVLSGVANDVTMAGCWWMAWSVSSTSYCISSAPLGLVMSLIAFVQSAVAFMTLSAWVMVGLVIFL